MNLLLDTHALLWWLGGDSRLGHAARRCLTKRENQACFSMASVWEMAVKMSLGKLTLTYDLEEMARELERHAIRPLQIQVRHCMEVARLPFHHRDPFDRLLVAQARCERLHLLSRDVGLDAYGVDRIW